MLLSASDVIAFPVFLGQSIGIYEANKFMFKLLFIKLLSIKTASVKDLGGLLALEGPYEQFIEFIRTDGHG